MIDTYEAELAERDTWAKAHEPRVGDTRLVDNPDVTTMIYRGWTTVRQATTGQVLMSYTGRRV
jgi:hypothetical protein